MKSLCKFFIITIASLAGFLIARNMTVKYANVSSEELIPTPAKKRVAKAPVAPKTVQPVSEIGARQSEIMELLAKKGEADMSDIHTKFPETSERTLRRDMNKLEELGLITRAGSTKATRYFIR